MLPFGCELLDSVMLTWEATWKLAAENLLPTWPATSRSVGSWSHCGHEQAEVLPLQKSMKNHRRDEFKVSVGYEVVLAVDINDQKRIQLGKADCK